MSSDFASNRMQGAEKLVLDLRRQVLVGKVDQRFLIGEDAPQPVGTFTWNGQYYHYVVTSTLPCFPPPPQRVATDAPTD